jgi:hypothetical protein
MRAVNLAKGRGVARLWGTVRLATTELVGRAATIYPHGALELQLCQG